MTKQKHLYKLFLALLFIIDLGYGFAGNILRPLSLVLILLVVTTSNVLVQTLAQLSFICLLITPIFLAFGFEKKSELFASWSFAFLISYVLKSLYEERRQKNE